MMWRAGVMLVLLLQPQPSSAFVSIPQHHVFLLSNNKLRHAHSKQRHRLQSSRRNMALIPLPVGDLERIISSSGKPTGAQYTSYWGRTKKEQYARFVESATVGFLGVFFSYFLSFVLGGFIATIFGCLFFFWGILSPEFKAYQRNWEFLGGRQLVDIEQVSEFGLDAEKAGLYGGLFLGCVSDVSVVEDTNCGRNDEYDLAEFHDYTMETDELDRFTGQPYLLRVQCSDQRGRTLQIHCRLSEDYLHLKPGMAATILLLSTSPKFSKLAALTDVFVLPTDEREGTWIGDYPYLDRANVESLLAEDDEIWDTLQMESDKFKFDDNNKTNVNVEDDYYTQCEESDLVASKRIGRR